MGKDIRQEAFNYLVDLANKQGYVTFDEIMDCAEEHDLRGSIRFLQFQHRLNGLNS